MRRGINMVVLIIGVMALIAFVGWGILAAFPREPWEDQEEMEYLAAWRERRDTNA